LVVLEVFIIKWNTMGNKKNQTKGIWIPEEIKVDKKLDWTNKALLSEIYSLCELPDGCIASDNHFGKLLGIGRTSVNKRVNKLEVLGYITAKNHFKGRLCIGRTITKGSSVEKHTIVPKVISSSSDDAKLVVPVMTVDSSVENTTNTITNSDLTIQKIIQYSGQTSNTGMSLNEFLNNRLEQLAVEAVDKSSLGENIFFYAEPATIELFKDAVGDDEFNVVFPVLKNIIEVEQKLSRR
jgi:biotin operon repressor